MSTKKELKLLTELLNLEGVKVSSHRQYEGIGIILQLEANGKESVCSRCGSNSTKLHQNRWHIIKDLSWGEKAVFLEINRRQFKCEKCQKPFSEEMGFVKERRTYTKRLATKILEEVLADDLSGVARKGVVNVASLEDVSVESYFDIQCRKRLAQRRNMLRKSITWGLIEMLLFTINPKSDWQGDYSKFKVRK